MKIAQKGRIITCVNLRGSVGRTSIIANLGALYAKNNAANPKKVLLVDLDPQATLSWHLLGIQRRAEIEKANVPLVMRASASDAVVGKPVETNVPSLHILPASQQLLDAAQQLSGKLGGVLFSKVRASYVEVHTALSQFLEPWAAEYDVILIDTPSNNLMLLRLALWASDDVIVPTRLGLPFLLAATKTLDIIALMYEEMHSFLDDPAAELTKQLHVPDVEILKERVSMWEVRNQKIGSAWILPTFVNQQIPIENQLRAAHDVVKMRDTSWPMQINWLPAQRYAPALVAITAEKLPVVLLDEDKKNDGQKNFQREMQDLLIRLEVIQQVTS